MSTQSSPARVLDVGVHYDIPASVYHADPCPTPSLNSGIARTILSRSIEHAALEHPRLGGKGRDATPNMDLGSLVHALLSGEKSFEVSTYPDFRTKAAQQWRDTTREAGKTPILEHTLRDAENVVTALIGRIGAGTTSNPFADHGRSEVTLVWKEGDIYCRARIDRLMIPPDGMGYIDAWDWKTTDDVSPRSIERKIISMGYHLQAAFYLRGLAALMPKQANLMSFLFAFVEVSSPHATRVAYLSPSLLTHAQRQIGDAIRRWQHALSSGDFSATNEPLEVELPGYLDALDDEISTT